MKPDLDAIRARCEAASGPAWTWETDDWTTTRRSSVSRIISMDAIRARQESGIETSARLPYLATVYGDADTAFIVHARTDIPALLAYIDELERDLLNERATFESCNRARQHCEHECATIKARTTYTVGETELAQRIATLEHMLGEECENVDTLRAAVEHAEQRFVDEYDARKAAEREIAELKARITTLEAMKP